MAVLDELFETETDVAPSDTEAEPDLFPEQETDSDADDAEEISKGDEDDEEESSEEETGSSEDEDDDAENLTARAMEDTAHVQFGGKGRFVPVTLRLEGNVMRMIQYKEGLGEGLVIKEWSLKITACTVRVPKKIREGPR